MTALDRLGPAPARDEGSHHNAYVEFDGRTYYAWCSGCDWHSPHRLVAAEVESFATRHDGRSHQL